MISNTYPKAGCYFLPLKISVPDQFSLAPNRVDSSSLNPAFRNSSIQCFSEKRCMIDAPQSSGHEWETVFSL